MNDLDLISEAKIEVTSSGVSETQAKVDQLAGSVEGLAVAQDDLSKAQIRVNAQLESTAKRYDAEYKAIRALADAQNLLARAQSQGLSGTEAYARIQENVTLKLQAQANAARVANEAQQKLASTIRQQAQSSINASTGVRSDFDTESRAADIAAYGAELDRVREKFVPVFAMSQQLARAQAEVSDALKTGAISANEAAEANLRLTRTYEDQTQKLERLDQTRKASAQRQVNQQLIVPDRGADIAAYAEAMNALQAEFDPLFAAEQKYIAYMERLDNALAVGAVKQDIYNKRAAEAGAALDKAAAAAAGLAVETEKVASTTNTAAAAQEHFNSLLGVKTDFGTAGRAADIEAYGRALTETRAKYDPVYRAQEQYREGLKQLRADFAAGAVPLEVFTARLAEQKAAFVDTAAALGMMSAREREYAESAQAAARVSQVESAKSGMAADVDAYVAALKRERAELVPTIAIEEQYKAAEERAASARDRGLISQQQYEAAVKRAAATQLNQTNELKKAEDANARVAKGVGLNAYAWQNLSYQVNDVITSLASGISPFQTLAQQGGQIYQILQSGQGGVGGALIAIKDRLLAIAPAVGVFGVLAAAAVAAAVATYRFVAAQRDVELALLGAGRAAGVSGYQIEDIAEKASRMSTITISAARDVEQAFLKGGKVYGEAFLPGTVAAENFAKASKQSVSDSAKFIGDALSNIKTDGLDKLNSESQNFDAGFRKVIEDLLQAGKVAEAQTLAVTRFGEAFKDVGDKALSSTSILNRMDQAFNRLATSSAKAISQAFTGAPLEDKLKSLESARQKSITISQAMGEAPDTSKIDAEIAAATKALNEQTVAREKNTVAARANRDASDQSATKTAVSAVANLEALKRDREILNAEMNALERQKASGIEVPAERFANNKQALEGVNHALRDYENAQGAANMESKKAQEVTDAQLQATKAVTPIEKAMAAAAMVRAQAYGTVVSSADLAKKANDAYAESMAQSRQQTINTNRNEDEATKTKNQLAEAALKQGNSLEFLKAQRQAEQEAAAGTISADEIESRRKAILSESIATLRQQKNDEIRAARDETAARQALNDKVAAGQMVSAEAARRQAAAIEQSKLAREVDAAEGEQKGALKVTLEELTVATEAQISAEKRAQVLSMSEETDRQIESLKKEAELLGSTNRERAIGIAALQAEQNLKRQGISLSAPESVEYINKEKLKADLTYTKDQYQRLSQDISSALTGVFDDMTGSGKKSLTSFLDSFSKGFSRIGSRMLEQNLISPLVSGGLGGGGGANGGASLIDKIGSFFGGQSAEKAVAGGAEKGIFSSLSEWVKPQSGGTGGGGGFASSKLGSGLVSAGIGASIGYQSQSPLIGGVGGALAGFATAGPIGAIVGGAAGILGGLFGESQAKKQAKKQLQLEMQARREAYEQAKPQIEALDKTFLGESIGAVGAKIVDAETQLKQAAKTASDAGDSAKANKLVQDYLSYVARMRAVFAESFEGTLKDIERGFGPNGPFASAMQTVQTLGEALKAFVADAAALPDPQGGQRARAAAVENALNALDPPKTLTETGTEIERIQGTAAGLNQVLKDLGLTAEQAATAINDRTNKALANLADKFNSDLDRKINSAKGKDYLNDTSDLIKEVGGLTNDAAALGQDPSKVSEYFSAAAQEIVDKSQLVGDAFNQLVAAFPQLAGKVHEFSADSGKSTDELAKQAAQQLAEIQDRKRAYEDRIFAVNFSDNSLATKLTAFDRAAEWEQWTESAKGGQAMKELLETQEAERGKLIYDYRQAVEERKRGYDDRTFAATNDSRTLGGQLAAADRQYQQDRKAEIEAGGDAINALTAAHEAERAKIISDYYEQVNARIRGFNERYFAAVEDQSSLGGKLAAFQRKAAQEQVDEAKAGGEAMSALLQAQGAEQQKIINDYYEAVRQRQSGFNDRAFNANNDTSTLGGQLAAFERTAAQDRYNEYRAGGEAINELVAAQEAERAKIIRDYYEAVNQRIQGYADRLFAATNDATTIAGQLAAFDRQAAQERIAEIKAGGEALNTLLQAQGAERQRIIDEYMQAIRERQQGYGDRYFAATNNGNSLAGQLAAFERQAQKDRIDELKAGGEAIADLTVAQEAERAKIIADYYEQVTQRIQGYADRWFAAVNDQTTLSGQLAAYDRQAGQDIAAEMKAGGEGLNTLLAAQAAERDKLIRDYQKAIEDRRAGYGDRYFAATNDQSSLAGQLAAFDRTAAKERLDEIKAGGEAINDLTMAQEAERAKIIQQYYEAVTERIKGYTDRYFAAINDDTTLAGKLAAFDRAAAAEQAAEMKAGGEGMAALLQAESAERAKLIEEYNRAVRNRAEGYQDRAFNASNDNNSLAGQLAAFERQALKDRLAEIQAGGEAINDLTAAQESERAKIIADYYAAVADRIRGYNDRLFAAVTDASTLAGQLALFDRNAAYEREQEAKAGGEGIVQLEAAQAAERLKIIQDFTKQAQSAFDSFAATIKKFLDGLTAGSNSPLSPQDRLIEAQRQYDEQLALARGGDKDALSNITSYAQSLLDASKAFYASSQAFQDTFKAVTNSLQALPGQVGVDGFMPKYADGGWVRGAGTGTSDSIIARLSAGEFVMSAASASRYGPLLEAMNDDRPTAAMPVRPPAATGNQGNAALAAELRALRAEVAALRGDVQEGTSVNEQGHLQSIAATKDVSAKVGKGNRQASRREVAA